MKPKAKQTDDSAKLLRAGRSEQLQQLMDEFCDMVLHLAVFYLKDRAQAEDIFQETFLRAYTHWDEFRGQADPKTWLYRITSNLCKDRLRSWSRRHIFAPGDDKLPLSIVASPEQELIVSEDHRDLLAAILTLPVRDRELIVYQYYEGLSGRQIAAIIGISEEAVRSRLARARKRLQRELVIRGYER